MAVTTTTRFGLYRWSDDSDRIIREHLDTSHANIETFGAKFLSGTSLPTIGSAEYARTFFINTSTKVIYFYSSDDALGEWVAIGTDVILVTLAENKGDLLVATGPDEWDILPVGTFGQVLTVTDNLSNIGWATILVTKGDLLSHDGSSLINLGVGLDNYLLIADSTEPSGLKWSLVNESSISDGAVTTSKFQPSSVIESKFSVEAVTSTQIADGAVTTEKILANSVTEPKLASASVITDKILNGAVTEIKIADNSIGFLKFAPGAVTTSKIVNSAVDSSAIASAAVATGVIADGAVITTKISDANVLSSNIADRSVTSAKIANGAVISSKLEPLSITTGKFADSSVQTAKIGNSAVVSSAIATSSVTESKLADQAVTALKFADGSVTSAKVADGAVTGGKILALNVTSDKVSANSVLSSVLRQSAGYSVIGNSSNSVSDVTDLTASSNGALLQRAAGSLGFSTLITNSISDGAVTSVKIASNTIVDSDIAANANISLTKLGSGILQSSNTVSTGNYLPSSVTWPKLSSAPTSEGVGVWLTYVPQVYKYVSSWATVTDLELLLPSQYDVFYAKYCKINEMIIVQCRITMNDNFNWQNQNNSGAIVTLPFTPTNTDYMCIGSGYFTNMDSPQNQSNTYALNVNEVSGVVFGMPEPNLHANQGATVRLPPGDLTPYLVSTFFEDFDTISFKVQYATTA